MTINAIILASGPIIMAIVAIMIAFWVIIGAIILAFWGYYNIYCGYSSIYFGAIIQAIRIYYNSYWIIITILGLL